jgi:hypothetical protein
MEPDFYHVVVRHRNHLGAMTESPLSLGATPTEINFADPDFPVNCTHGVVTIGSKRALWGGDINRDGRLIFQGPGNDVLKIFTTVLYDPENTGHTAYFVSKGYAQGDANMDGKTIYQGPGNDKAMVMLFLLIHLQLVDLDFYSQYVVIECVP